MKILCAPTAESASSVENVSATVEAEYGDICISGEKYTLAHHGSRSHNPAPCNWEGIEPLESDATILISHIDLDTIGGILALMGEKPENPEFWKAAEFIDVNGVHHMHELSQDVQNELNAFYAWSMENGPRGRRIQEVTDVTDTIEEYKEAVHCLLGEHTPERQTMIENGIAWEREQTQAVENCLVQETPHVRLFETDSVFCNANYYSPKLQQICDATVAFNSTFKAVTVAFADGGKTESAREWVQSFWGPKAGGRDGIAGSPRGQEMTFNDAKKIASAIHDKLQMRTKEMPSKAVGILKDDSKSSKQKDASAVGREAVSDNKIDISKKTPDSHSSKKTPTDDMVK